MTTFTYTIEAEPASSYVEGVVYNENTNELAISLRGDWYRYKNVPVSVYRALVTGDGYSGSVGKYYRNVVRPQFGPAEHLGWAPSFEPEYAKPYAKSVSDVTTAEKVAPPTKEEFFSGTNEYTVTFEFDGKEYPATAQAANDVSAVREVESKLKALGLNFTLKGVSRTLG